jgi:hypothetical protein
MEESMTRSLILATTTLVLSGAAASAQTVYVTPGYATPAYVAPTYVAPIYMAPAPVYMAPAPIYMAPAPIYVAPSAPLYDYAPGYVDAYSTRRWGW